MPPLPRMPGSFAPRWLLPYAPQALPATRLWAAGSACDPFVLAALGLVAREEFVPHFWSLPPSLRTGTVADVQEFWVAPQPLLSHLPRHGRFRGCEGSRQRGRRAPSTAADSGP
jgi:hypothetical protein